MRKYASLEVLEAWRQPAPGADGRIVKAAHRVAFEYQPREGYLYVRSRMISSRTNDNHDTFPAGEIEKGYRSFLGKPVFVNHHNASHRRARGVIVAVALHRDANRDGSPDTWVEGLMEVDAVKFPRLAKAILAKRVNRTSMGVDVEWSKCSACGNKATSPAEYCKHLPAMKGKKIRQRNQVTGKVEEKLIHEVCAGLSFFENSLLVEDPADPTALVLGTPDARGLNMSPRKASTNRPDGRRAYTVPIGDGLERELSPSRTAAAGRYQGQKFVLDDPDVGIGELDRWVAYTRQTAPLGHHVGRVDRTGSQEPVPHVHAEQEVARVADHQLRRNRAAQQPPAVAMGPDTRAPRVRKGESRVAAVERPSRPWVAHSESWAEINRRKETVRLGNRSDELSAHFRPADHGIYSTASAQDLRGFGDLQPHEQRSVAQYHQQMVEDGQAHPSSTPHDYLYESRQEPKSDFLNRYMDADEEFKKEYGPGDWEAHHAETLATHPVPSYPSANRWPLIVNDANRNYVDDGYHRMHSYMRDGATNIPTVRMHPKTAYLLGEPDSRGMKKSAARQAARKKPAKGGTPRPVRGYGSEPRFDGVSLKKDSRGFFVHTHRARSDSYGHPDDIPDADLDYIRSTGAKAAGGDHPWFRAHPVSRDNITAAYHDATDDEKALGDRWYSDAHHVARAIAGGDAAVGAGLLSAYSPQTAWPVNLFNASRAAKGDPPGPGTGAMGSQQKPALRILGGEHHSQVLKAPKTSAFAHLIEHGGDSPDDESRGKSRVVVDRHAMSVAAGRRLSKEESGSAPLGQGQHYEHVEQLYRDAAKDISEAAGRKVSPHQVQAATWLRQVRRNQEADSSGQNGGGGKGRVVMHNNSQTRWTDHHREHHPGQIDPENLHYHGALNDPPPREPWPSGSTHCTSCGQELNHPGNPGGKPASRLAPHLCQNCLGHIGWKEDSGTPGYMNRSQEQDLVRGETSRPYGSADMLRSSQNSLAKTAYGETRVPPQVDTLRMDECPVCGEHNVWSGSRCPVCGFVVPPSVFRDPDTSRAGDIRDQLDSSGDVALPPESGAQQDQAAQPAMAQPPDAVGSGDDASQQLLHPDQIAPDGVPVVQGGDTPAAGTEDDAMVPPGQQDPAAAGPEAQEMPPGPDGAVPPEDGQEEDPGGEMYAEELVCPACGTTFEADAAAQPGVPCPACGMAALHPADDEGGAAPPEEAEDPSSEGEQPGEEQDEEDEDKDMPESKTAAAVARAQARRIAELSARNEVLEGQLRFLASAAGVEGQFAEIQRRVMTRHADILNPASPVPDPPEAPPTETTEQALMPESMDNAGRPGTTPGANSRVPAQQTTTAITPGVEIQTPPATNLVDVTAPVQGTNPSQDGGVPLSQRRIETDVRIDPDPLKASGPGIGGQGNNGSAFPWILDAQGGGQGQQGQQKAASLEGDTSRRTFASIRLAKLRVQAGLAQGEELAVAERIEHDAALATPVIEHEISVLSQMPLAQQRQAARPVQRTAARSVPSLASVGASAQYAPAAADDLDASDLFD